MTQTPTLEPVKWDIKLRDDWAFWWPELRKRLKYIASLGLPSIKSVPGHEGTCAIVGAAPTVGDHLPRLRELSDGKYNIVASVNGAHQWLLGQGLTPNIHVLCEWDASDTAISLGGPPHSTTCYYVCSHDDPLVVAALLPFRSVVWHALYPQGEYKAALQELFPGDFMVGGGWASFLRTITIAWILGYRDFELFGLDSSYKGDSSHFEGYKIAEPEPDVRVWVEGEGNDQLQEFRTNGSLAYQASQFMEFCAKQHSTFSLRVHGDGLLSFVHRSRYPEQYQR